MSSDEGLDQGCSIAKSLCCRPLDLEPVFRHCEAEEIYQGNFGIGQRGLFFRIGNVGFAFRLTFSFSWQIGRRGAPQKRPRVHNVIFADALADEYPNGCVALVDLRRVGVSCFSGGAPVLRNVHRPFDLYFRYDIPNVLTTGYVNVSEQSINHRGQ